jgi:recombinational DNA repair ATPase RecF
MTVAIRKIEVKAFRGLPEFKLDLDGKSLLLRGDNGTGKSSVVQAFEFFFTGKVADLEGVVRLSLAKHGPHVNYKQSDVEICVTFDPGAVRLKRTFSSAPSLPVSAEELNQYFRVMQKGKFILRRFEVLEFIITQPAERFRAIATMIGVDALDSIELEMKNLRDDFESRVNSTRSSITNLLREISGLAAKEVHSNDQILPALNERLLRDGLPPLHSFAEAGKHAEEMLKNVKGKGGASKTAELLSKISSSLTEPVISEDMGVKAVALESKVRELLEKRAKDQMRLVGLLEAGKSIIAEGKLDRCPLCEQPISADEIIPKLQSRLQLLEQLSNEASQVRKFSSEIVDRLKEAKAKITSIVSQASGFQELQEQAQSLVRHMVNLDSIIGKAESTRDLEGILPAGEVTQLAKDVNGAAQSFKNVTSELVGKVELTEAEKKVLANVALIGQVGAKTAELERLQRELQICERQFRLAERIYSTFVDAKNKKIQEVYDSIQNDVQNFYDILHPDEPHKNVELIVSPGKRASTDLYIESFGRKREDPRALASEGHLNSLGLCIFLAFVKNFNAGCSLIVLDDVVTTIDSNHRKNVCSLLLDQFPNAQLVITTHDGIWYQQLCNWQESRKIAHNFLNLEIVSWSIESGPKFHRYEPTWEEIEKKIEEGNKKAAGNLGRDYLEWVLKRICENLQVPLYRESGKYTVNELFDPAEKRIQDLLKEGEQVKSDLLAAFQRLKTNRFIANLLAHDNIGAEALTISEVRDFCESVQSLRAAFSCDQCSELLFYSRDLRIVMCPKNKCDERTKCKVKIK